MERDGCREYDTLNGMEIKYNLNQRIELTTNKEIDISLNLQSLANADATDCFNGGINSKEKKMDEWLWLTLQ